MKLSAGVYDKVSKTCIYNGRIRQDSFFVENIYVFLFMLLRVFGKLMILEPEKAAKLLLICVFLKKLFKKLQFA